MHELLATFRVSVYFWRLTWNIGMIMMYFVFFKTIGYLLLETATKDPTTLWQQERLWMPSLMFLEKAMAPHSSTLAWRILWTEEPGGLQFMGSQRV